jgi:hypothetical protein
MIAVLALNWLLSRRFYDHLRAKTGITRESGAVRRPRPGPSAAAFDAGVEPLQETRDRGDLDC